MKQERIKGETRGKLKNKLNKLKYNNVLYLYKEIAIAITQDC